MHLDNQFAKVRKIDEKMVWLCWKMHVFNMCVSRRDYRVLLVLNMRLMIIAICHYFEIKSK